MSTSRPSIKDVARHSGTSISTVSNVLNNRRYVSEELRERVLRSVRELGYSANPIARNLKSRRTNTVGVIVTDINRIFFPPMLKGIQNVLSRAGYTLTICDTRDDARRELEAIRMMRNNWVDGLILDSLADRLYPDFFESLAAGDQEKSMPIVSVERDLTRYRIDSVFIDNQQSSRTAVNHLIELGCRRIAHIAGPQSSGLAAERLAGYRQALIQNGIQPDEGLICQGDFSPVSGYNATQQLLKSARPFDGIFAANDQMALGALHALKNASLAVPAQVKVVGFDNTFAASIVSPSLTTISVSSYDMGTRAAQQLLERIENPAPAPVAIQLDYDLIVRSSTIASSHTSWDMTYW